MKVLKHMKIAYLLEKQSSKTLNFFQKQSANLSLINSLEELISFLKKSNIDILIIEKNIDDNTLTKLRKLNVNMHIIVLKDSVNKNNYYAAIKLTNILFIEFEINENRLKDIIKVVFKTIDSNKTNIQKLENSFIFDTYNNTLFKNESIIPLSNKESMFLGYIINNKDKAITYDEINKALWDGDMTQNALRSVVKEVRRKTYKDLVKNISGTGYKANLK
ncbi:MAG: winged helix-turn-helix domain-containing protein [Campylobacterota bacterium]